MEHTVVYISLGILFLGFCAQVFTQKKNIPFFAARRKTIGVIFLFSGILFILGHYFFSVFLQYDAWKIASPPARFLVPPYRSIEYVFSFVFFRSLFYYIFSAIGAAAVFYVLRYMNKKRGDVFFEDDELLYACLAIFLLGFSGWNYLWVWYGVGIFVITFLASILNPRIRRGEDRFSMYFLWLPLAIIGILIMEFVRMTV